MTKAAELPGVTRIVVVFPDGTVWEKHRAFSSEGVELHLQDDGRTLKIFPRRGND